MYCQEGNIEWVAILIKDMQGREFTSEELSSYMCGSLQPAFKNGHYKILKLLLKQKGKFVLNRDSGGKMCFPMPVKKDTLNGFPS